VNNIHTLFYHVLVATSMTTQTSPAPGQKWVRLHRHYTILAVEDGIVTMQTGAQNQTVKETVTRFTEEAQAGRAVHHPECDYCGLPVDPAEGEPGPLHYECWFQHATVQERCEAEADRPGGFRSMAAEALRADDPRGHLLDVIGDPARSLHDRNDAEHFLTYAVSTSEILDAQVRCPNCREGEAFQMDPATGAVHCHCGELLKEAD
jgi:hypothetical protein